MEAWETGKLSDAYVGLILVIFSPDFDFTNSLLINMPVGRENFLPLGAVRSMERSDIFVTVEVTLRR